MTAQPQPLHPRTYSLVALLLQAMSKPISFGFSKPRSPAPSRQSISLAARKSGLASGTPRSTLHHDSDNEEDEEPRHESVTGFSSSGAILSQPVQDTSARVIHNAGNADWRQRGGRGRNLLPAEVQAQKRGEHVVRVERDEISQASGLQFAERDENEKPISNGTNDGQRPEPSGQPPSSVEKTRPLTADDEALQALLGDGTDRPRSNAVIVQQGNAPLSTRDELEDFRADVASRPDPSTLEDYAAMPVEEFGMAMLRGMGQKRRANGEKINLERPPTDSHPPKLRRHEGFLGIGAKAAPGSDFELGAWGKVDMRKNVKGQGFFTPLMRENKATGERLTEEELQQRIRDAKGRKEQEDWKTRRDRNLESDGRDRDRGRRNGDSPKAAPNGDDHYREQMNAFSRQGALTRRERDHDGSRSRRESETRDYDRSRSRRDRSRSGERRRRDDDYDRRPWERHRDRYREEDRYDSSASRRSGHRDRDRDGDRRERDSR